MNTKRNPYRLVLLAACALGVGCAPVARVAAAEFFIADGDVPALIAAINTSNAASEGVSN